MKFTSSILALASSASLTNAFTVQSFTSTAVSAPIMRSNAPALQMVASQDLSTNGTRKKTKEVRVVYLLFKGGLIVDDIASTYISLSASFLTTDFKLFSLFWRFI